MLIKVKVYTNSKKEEVIQKAEDSFEVRVRAKPIQGQANRAVAEALALFLKIPENKIRLIRGSKTRNKIFALKQPDITSNDSGQTQNRTCSGSGSKTI